MNIYTLHIRENSRWYVFDRFGDRDSAMVIASRLRNSGEYSGVKILEGVVDQSTFKSKDNIVYAWTTKSKDDEVNENTKYYMERIKNSRVEKEKKNKIKRRERRKRIKEVFTKAAIVCVFLAGVYALYLLKNS